jgi:hypothetical protein
MWSRLVAWYYGPELSPAGMAMANDTPPSTTANLHLAINESSGMSSFQDAEDGTLDETDRKMEEFDHFVAVIDARHKHWEKMKEALLAKKPIITWVSEPCADKQKTILGLIKQAILNAFKAAPANLEATIQDVMPHLTNLREKIIQDCDQFVIAKMHDPIKKKQMQLKIIDEGIHIWTELSALVENIKLSIEAWKAEEKTAEAALKKILDVVMACLIKIPVPVPFSVLTDAIDGGEIYCHYLSTVATGEWNAVEQTATSTFGELDGIEQLFNESKISVTSNSLLKAPHNSPAPARVESASALTM